MDISLCPVSITHADVHASPDVCTLEFYKISNLPRDTLSANDCGVLYVREVDRRIRVQRTHLSSLLRIAEAEASGDTLCGCALMHSERESNYLGPWLLSSEAS